jgi:ATP-dependent Lon protease
MATTQTSSRSLPQRPSEEYLRKEAKRLAREEGMQLATAQRRLAREYGYSNWAELVTAVQRMMSAGAAGSGGNPTSPGSPTTRGSAPNVFPFLALRGLVAFPHVSYPIFVGRPMSINAVLYAQEHEVPILLAAQKDPVVSDPSNSDIYDAATIAGMVQTLRLSDGTMKTIVEGKRRARVSRFIFNEDFSRAEAWEIEESTTSNAEIEKLVTSVVSAFLRNRESTLAEALSKPGTLWVSATTTHEASALADRIASELQMELAWKQALLELLDPADRMEKLLTYLNALNALR